MIKNLLLTSALSLFAMSAVAQDTVANVETASEVANNSSFGDWLIRCEAITVSKNACRLVQELTLREGNALVARFIALPVKDGAAVLLAQVPIGVYLPGGAVYRLADTEGEEQREMIWQRCLGELCEAAISLSAEEIEKFATAKGILFGYRANAEADPIVVRVDVAEFANAITAIAAKE